jgi:protein-disulfide isomerase
MTRNRLYLVAAAAVAAVVVVAVIAVVAASGDSGSPTTTTGAPQTPSGSSIFAGVPQHGDTLGRADAPATLTVFEDPQCPYCKQWNLDTLPTVVRDYVRTGRLKIVYRGIAILGADSLPGLRAAYAAAAQNKLWNVVEALYQRQGEEQSGWITTAVIKDAAASAHANATQLVSDAGSKTVTSALNGAETERQSYGVDATPTFTLQRQLGTLQQLEVTSLEPEGFSASLAAALQ